MAEGPLGHTSGGRGGRALGFWAKIGRPLGSGVGGGAGRGGALGFRARRARRKYVAPRSGEIFEKIESKSGISLQEFAVRGAS